MFSKNPSYIHPAWRSLLFALVLFSSSFSFSQTTLSPGDIAVIGFKTNTSTDAGDDAVKLVTLVDLECNTTFIVTDNNWNGSAWACSNDESALQITCNSAIAAGSVFYIDYDAAGNTCTCSGGSITRTDLGSPWGTNFGFNSGGDNCYILQGTRASPSFVYAFKHISPFSSNTCTDKDQANLPTNLTLGTSAICMPSSKNQWNFNCVMNNGTQAAILAAIGNTANWLSNTTHVWDATNGIFRVTGAALPYGVLQVSGAGCGFTQNCLLAYAGAANSASVSGNCSAGQTPMSASIVVPAGCTYNVMAQFMKRSYGCSNSGMDGGDQLKVDIVSGVKSFLTGASNANVGDSYNATGPATVVVSGTADRADEIITYSVQATPCACLVMVLPIELVEFTARKSGPSVELQWTTATEKNNNYFTIQRSVDAANWEELLQVPGRGNSDTPYSYKVYDASPLKSISYYRLKQTDFDQQFSYSRIVSVNNPADEGRKIIRRVDMLGRDLDENATGL
ncbi:MAG: hypothetical protein ACXVPD_02305, partial [Bacteroidia bacterium]